MKLHVKKGDTVLVLSGKDAGKRAKVLRAFPTEGKVLVEGINVVTKHNKRTKQNAQPGISHIESPLNIAKVMLVCSKCSSPTRISKRVVEDKNVRVCKKCGEIIDKL